MRSSLFRFGLVVSAAFAVVSAWGFSQEPNKLANVEVLIVRHAERQGDEDLLTPDGVKRAAAYAKYFSTLTIGDRHIKLTHLFAEKSVRTRGTLEPTAKALKMPLDTRFATKQLSELVEDLKGHSYGPEVLICWHHSSIPKLITAFGGNPEALLPDGKWPKTTFDWIVDLRFDATGALTATSQSLVHEHLMPGDSK